MESEHKEDGNKQVSEDGEYIRIDSEETESIILLSETHSRPSSSSSSSSSSSAYSSPPKNLPESLIDEAEISSPPVQVMERDDNKSGSSYDPNRIPSSVFARSESNIPAEWSCTSNESLFSIHLGQNSFSVRGTDLMRSGELLAYSPALPMPPPPGPEPKPPVEEESKVLVDSNKEEKVLVVEETLKEDKRESHEKEQHPAVSWKTPTTSYRSNRNSNSAHSFSFPM